MKAVTGIVLCVVLGLAGCAQRQQAPSDFGEAMEQRGDVNKAVADQWERGNDKVQRGTRMVEEARKDTEEGERLIREGRNEMRAAESDARVMRQQPVPVPPAPAPSAPAAPSSTSPDAGYPRY